jgi:hypothetical protein
MVKASRKTFMSYSVADNQKVILCAETLSETKKLAPSEKMMIPDRVGRSIGTPNHVCGGRNPRIH